MKVFVTGASGFIGGALVTELLRNSSYEVSYLVRNISNKQLAGCTAVLGDLTDIPSFKDALSGHDVIIHCAGRAHIMNDRAKDPLKEFRLVNTESTARLAEAGASAGVRRFIFLSSIKVNGEETTPGQPFDHKSSPRPADPYGVSKHEAEMRLRELPTLSALEVCIIRPTLVYGDGMKGNVRRLVRLIERGLPIPFASAKHNKRSMVHIDNLVSLIITCIQNPNAAGQTFLVSDDRDLSTAEFIGVLGNLCARPAKQVSFPLWIMHRLARSFCYDAEFKRLTGTLQVNIEHTKSVLGWKPPRHLVSD